MNEISAIPVLVKPADSVGDQLSERRSYTLRLGPEYRSATEIQNREILYVALTRINLAMDHEGFRPHYVGEEQEAAWLRERIALFRTFCLPSIVGQTVPPDALVVLLDANVTEPIAELLEDLLDHRGIIPILLPTKWGPQMVPRIRETLNRRFHLDRYADVCTIRIDSDDALNRHYMAATDATVSLMKEVWHSSPNRCVSFAGGCRFHNGRFPTIHQPSQFLSLVEPSRNFRTCLRRRHHHMNDIADFVDVTTDEPMFLYTVHGAATTNNPLSRKNRNLDHVPEHSLDLDYVSHLFSFPPELVAYLKMQASVAE